MAWVPPRHAHSLVVTASCGRPQHPTADGLFASLWVLIPAATASPGPVAPSYLYVTGEEMKDENLQRSPGSSSEARAPKCEAAL